MKVNGKHHFSDVTDVTLVTCCIGCTLYLDHKSICKQVTLDCWILQKNQDENVIIINISKFIISNDLW